MKKNILIILLFLIVVMLAIPVTAQNENSNIKAEVIKNNGVEEVKQENITRKVQNITVRILEGEYENEEYEMTYIITEDTQNFISNIELKEQDKIIIGVEEKEGEIVNINYKETVTQKYFWYIALIGLILLTIIIGKSKVIKPMIIFLVLIALISSIIIVSLQKGWNLILSSSILAFFITVCILTKANGFNKKTIEIISCIILEIIISAILMYLLFDIINLYNVNIKITQSIINIKDVFVSITILIASGLSCTIAVTALKMDSDNNKQYKTKSDNIIGGQRSLKL